MSVVKTTMPKDLFSRLLNLHTAKPWLIHKRAEVESLHAICSNNDELDLIIDLLHRFRHLGEGDIGNCTSTIAHQIANVWKLSSADTVIVGKDFEKQGKVDSSQAVVYFMKSAFAPLAGAGWAGANFAIQTKKVLSNPDVKNLVLVDDFSGTGDSVTKFLDWIDDTIATNNYGAKSVYVCFFCAMENTRKQAQSRLGNKLFAVEWLKKGITDYEVGEKRTARIKMMRGIEKSLNIGARYSLGYGQSETLYSTINFNTPNNNFPIFWMGGKGTPPHLPLFPRLSK